VAYERIIARINIIDQKIAEIKDWCPKEKEQYISDKKGQAAIERNIQVIIQAILDICIQFIKLFKIGPPTSDENVINSLRSYLNHTDKMLELKKFRNYLVHIYGKINSKIVYEFALQMIKDIPIIVTEFKTLLEKKT
jgi:uncharacterized protein YutE (UPF0331/DUF86 family)